MKIPLFRNADIQKGSVKGHQRKSKSGKISVVRDYEKKQAMSHAKRTIDEARSKKSPLVKEYEKVVGDKKVEIYKDDKYGTYRISLYERQKDLEKIDPKYAWTNTDDHDDYNTIEEAKSDAERLLRGKKVSFRSGNFNDIGIEI